MSEYADALGKKTPKQTLLKEGNQLCVRPNLLIIRIIKSSTAGAVSSGPEATLGSSKALLIGCLQPVQHWEQTQGLLTI